jgi:hypothetical protein
VALVELYSPKKTSTAISQITTDVLAQIKVKSPQHKTLIFLVIKERPEEAPFMA